MFTMPLSLEGIKQVTKHLEDFQENSTLEEKVKQREQLLESLDEKDQVIIKKIFEAHPLDQTFSFEAYTKQLSEVIPPSYETSALPSSPPPYSETNGNSKLSEEAIGKLDQHFENLSFCEEEDERKLQLEILMEELTNQTDKNIISSLQESFSFEDPFDLEKYKLEIKKYLPIHEEEREIQKKDVCQSPMFSSQFIESLHAHFERMTKFKDEKNRSFQFNSILKKANEEDKVILEQIQPKVSFGSSFNIEQYKLQFKPYLPKEKNEENEEKEAREEEERQESTLTTSIKKESKERNEARNEEGSNEKGIQTQNEERNEEQINEALKKNEKMPECSEKRVNQLILFVEAIRNKIEKLGDKEVNEKLIDNEVELLFEQIGKEEPIIAEKFTRNFQELKQSRQVFDWKKMKRELLEMLTHWKVLDLGEILELIEKTNEASTSIENQDILLLLGKTGAGKSTTIHYLTGSEFEKRTENGITHYTPVKCSPSLQKVATAFHAKSETRYVTAIPVNFKEVGVNKKGGIVICDTPGFDDTRGPEIDIANGIGLIRAISKSKSVRLVILISGQGMGDKCDGLRDIVHTLVGMLPSIEDHLDAFSYVFVKCSPDQKNSIHGYFKSLEQNLNEEEERDEAFCQLIGDMIQKTNKDILFVSLEGNDEGQRINLLRSLAGTASISNPRNYFTPFVTEKSQSLIQEQANLHQNQIIGASKRNNYELIQYKLNELKSLCDILETNERVKRCYEESIQSLKETMKSIYNSATANLKKCFDEENKLTQQDLQDYLDSYNILKLTISVRNSHLGHDAISLDALLLFLNIQVKKLTSCTLELEFEIGSQVLLKNLDKLKLISEFDSKFNAQNALEYKKVQDYFKGKFESNIKKNKILINEDKISESSKIMDQMKQASETLTSHFDETWLTSQYQQLIQDFEKYFTTITSIDSILEKKKIDEKDIKILISKIEKLETIRDDISLRSYISIETIQDAHNKFINSVLNFFNGFVIEINNSMEQNGGDLKSIKNSIDQMTLLRRIPHIDGKTAESYHRTINLVLSTIDKLNTEMEEILESLMSGDYIEPKKLEKVIIRLTNSTWIKELEESNYSERLYQFQESLNFYILRLQEKSKQIRKNSDIEGMKKILNQLPNVANLENLVPNYSETRKIMINQFEETISKKLKNFESLLKNQNSEADVFQVDFCQFQSALDFLENLQETFGNQPKTLINKTILERTSKISMDLKNLIQKHVSSSRQDIQSALKKIADDGKPDLKTFSAKIRHFTQLVREVNEKSNPKIQVMESIHPNDLKYLNNWYETLVRLYNEMDEIIGTLKDDDPSKLDVKLKIVKILGDADPIFQANNDPRSFWKLYQENQRLRVNDNKGVSEKAIQAIIDERFQQAASELRMLKNNGTSQTIYNQILEQLSIKFTNCCEEVCRQSLLLNFNEKEIQSLISASTKIRDISKYLLAELNDKQKGELKETKKKVQGHVIQKLSKIVNGIKESIKAYNFLEAQKKKEEVKEIFQTLNTYIDGLQQIDEEINQLEKYEKEIMKDIKDIFETKSLDTYYLDPPKDIYEKLSQVKDKSEYRDFISELKKILDTKIREGYLEAKQTNPFSAAEKKFKIVESVIKKLPEDLHHLQGELDDARNDAKQVAETNRKEFQENLKRGIELHDPKIIITCLNSQEGAHSKNEIQKQVHEEVQKLNKKIQDHISKKEIIEAFPLVQTMIDFSAPFREKMSKTKSITISIVNEHLTTILTQIRDSLVNIRSSTPSPESLDKNFGHFKLFLSFQKEYKQKYENLANEICPSKMREMIDQIHSTLEDHTNNVYSFHDKLLENLDKNDGSSVDVSNLQKAFDNLKKMDPLLQKFQAYSQNPIDPAYTLTFKYKVLSYDQVLREFASKIQKIHQEVTNIDLLATYQIMEKERKQFYENLKNQLNILQCVSELKLNFQRIDFTSLYSQSLKNLESKFQELKNELDPIFLKSDLTKSDFSIIHSRYTNLAICSETITDLQSKLQPIVTSCRKQINMRTTKFGENVRTSIKIEVISNSLIQMKKVSENLPTFQVQVNSEIDYSLSILKKNGGALIAKVAVYLENEPEGIGQTIIAEHPVFKGYLIYLFNSKTTHDIEHVLDHLEGDDLDLEKLRASYKTFEVEYQDTLKDLLIKKHSDSLVAEIKKEQKDLQMKDSIKYTISIRDTIPKLIAKIFALWTYQNSSHYFESEGVSSDHEREKYLLKPHPAQVISIFRLLCIGYKDDREPGFWNVLGKSLVSFFNPKIPLFNNLVQIGTGEGKSVTLAVTSIVLALFGFEVNCTCYSRYLSQRDLADFEPLFTLLGVQQHINYGTFNQICERIINEKGKIRKRVENLVSSSTSTSTITADPNRAKILLIDEVDVFFNKEFYGNVYTPISTLKGPEITNLINYIWKNKGSLVFSRLKSSAEYQACCKKYPEWRELIEEASKDLISDVKNFEHSYIVLEDKIGYKEQDSISFKVNYGYKTMFAYFKECDNGKITNKSRDENICININCGSFSYAELPSKFSYIMGVTGTLETLSDPEEKVIRDIYHIMKKTYSPSVFGANNRQFKPETDVKIESLADYYNSISKEITDRLVGKTQGTQRSVLVFFESKEKLMEFYNSSSVTTLKDNIQIMTEELTSSEKNTYIKRATSTGQITLLSRTFGRGTDFVCRDQIVGANGGVHVIQVFLSEELSEETQIQGRTARQGDHGSYSMILLDQSLEKFTNLDELKEAQKKEGVYDFLNEKRNDYFINQYQENEKFVKEAKIAHEKAEEFVLAMDRNDIGFIKKYLCTCNKGAEIGGSRTVCLMDATGSMSGLLQKAKNTVGIMFERARVVLDENGLASCNFELQFVVYRNYNSREDKLLQFSGWESKSDKLRNFMKSIQVEGGLGNEAIEIGLSHVNEISDSDLVNQVILIGDAPPNTQQEVGKKRSREFGESYWKTTKYHQPTFYQTEIQQLQQKGIPVHAFYVDKYAKTVFEEISQTTNGTCNFLDINSEKGAELLTDLVTQQILRNAGGSDGEKLVEWYQQKFKMGHKE